MSERERAVDRLPASQLNQFMKRFRFQKGTLKGIRLHHRSPREQVAILSLVVTDTTKNEKVRLKLRFDGVDEYRFQRRPSGGLVRLSEVRMGYFDGLIYLNLDAYPDEDAPQVMDFRASDAFIAGRDVSYEVSAKTG
jgi:hypothetical protein